MTICIVCAGERGVQPPQTNGVPRPGLLRPLHADPGGYQQRSPAAHRHHSALHRLQNRSEFYLFCFFNKCMINFKTSRLCVFFLHHSWSSDLLSPLQEIYPPKIYEFAYVTDGACDMWDIQRIELQILKVTPTV